MKKTDQAWERPAGVTLKEIRDRLEWFGVTVSFDALRMAVRQLGIVHVIKGRGPESGRGHAFYYDYAVLWFLATVYRAAYTPRTKFEEVARWLAHRRASEPEGLSIAEHFMTGQQLAESEPVVNHKWLRDVYLEYVTHPQHGLGLRALTEVARAHWAETGLDDADIAEALLAYKRRVLVTVGVGSAAANVVGLRGGVA